MKNGIKNGYLDPIIKELRKINNNLGKYSFERLAKELSVLISWCELNKRTNSDSPLTLEQAEESDAVNFMNWTSVSDCEWEMTDEDQWTKNDDNEYPENITTAQLYMKYKEWENNEKLQER